MEMFLLRYNRFCLTILFKEDLTPEEQPSTSNSDVKIKQFELKHGSVCHFVNFCACVCSELCINKKTVMAKLNPLPHGTQHGPKVYETCMPWCQVF